MLYEVITNHILRIYTIKVKALLPINFENVSAIMKEKLYFVLSMIIFGAVGIFAKYINMSSSKIALFLSLIGLIFLLVIFIGKKQALSWSIIKKNAFRNNFV